MANEKRLIDANALNAVIRGIAKNIKRPSAVELMCICQIAEQPTVDAVEVIRCKDCKHFVHGEPYDPCECMKWKVKFGVAYTEPDGYCHKGERKDNG